MCKCMCVFKLLTSVADHAYRWRGEDEDTFPKQRKLPQHHDLLPEKTDELGHAARWVRDLQEANQDKYNHFLFLFGVLWHPILSKCGMVSNITLKFQQTEHLRLSVSIHT